MLPKTRIMPCLFSVNHSRTIVFTYLASAIISPTTPCMPSYFLTVLYITSTGRKMSQKFELIEWFEHGHNWIKSWNWIYPPILKITHFRKSKLQELRKLGTYGILPVLHWFPSFSLSRLFDHQLSQSEGSGCCFYYLRSSCACLDLQ